MEMKLDTLSNSVMEMQKLIRAQGLLGTDDKVVSRKKGEEQLQSRSLESDTTIYENAVKKIIVDAESEITFQLKDRQTEQINENENNNNSNRQDSLGSDNQIDTSDDLLDNNEIANDDMHNRFIAECQAEAERWRSKSPRRSSLQQLLNLMSGEQMVREAEASRACILRTKGKEVQNLGNNLVTI